MLLVVPHICEHSCDVFIMQQLLNGLVYLQVNNRCILFLLSFPRYRDEIQHVLRDQTLCYYKRVFVFNYMNVQDVHTIIILMLFLCTVYLFKYQFLMVQHHPKTIIYPTRVFEFGVFYLILLIIYFLVQPNGAYRAFFLCQIEADVQEMLKCYHLFMFCPKVPSIIFITKMYLLILSYILFSFTHHRNTQYNQTMNIN